MGEISSRTILARRRAAWLPRFSNHRLLALALVPVVLLWALAQRPASSQFPWRDWKEANQAWLLGQVTPNPVVPEPSPARRGLVLSYDFSPREFPQGFHRSSIYDNALAALTFFIIGNTDAAALTLHALGRLVRPDGSLWFSYNTANSWPDERDHESAIVRAGAVAWVGYALTFYVTHAKPCPPGDAGCARERAFFLHTATRLGDYLLSLQVVDPADPRRGLLRLGYGSIELAHRADIDEVVEIYHDAPALGISSENNISAWFFFRKLREATGDGRWSHAAARLRDGLLRSAWNDETGQFNRGFDSRGAADTIKALDCASWGALFLLATDQREKARRAVEAVETYYQARDGGATGYRPYFDHPIYETEAVGKYFFPEDPRKQWRDLPLVWAEGTLAVALAYLRLGQPERARKIVAGLRVLQVEGSGLRYASTEVPHEMARVPGAAASTWLVLVLEALTGNPLHRGFLQ